MSGNTQPPPAGQPNHEPTRFHSDALAKAAETGSIYVDNIFSNSFRLLIWLRFIRKLVPLTVFFINYIIWLIIRLFAIIFGWCGCGDGTFASSTNLRDVILRFVIAVATSGRGMGLNDTSLGRNTQYSQQWRKAVWRTFWRLYAVLAYDIKEFIHDYCLAWNVSEAANREFILFIDNGARLVIPCTDSIKDDKDLLQRIRVFYNLSRAQGGIFEFLGTKSSLRVDIVTLVQSYAVGTRVGLPLDLGRYGPFSRLVHYLRDPSEMAGSPHLMARLTDEGVITPPREQTHGLNIVRAWDPYITSIIVIIPVLFSLIISVVWAVVASVRYDADVNTSTQTGFTIGSYVVTAGALLIALVAFLDSKYIANDGVSSNNESSQPGSLAPSSFMKTSSQTPSEQRLQQSPLASASSQNV